MMRDHVPVGGPGDEAVLRVMEGLPHETPRFGLLVHVGCDDDGVWHESWTDLDRPQESSLAILHTSFACTQLL